MRIRLISLSLLLSLLASAPAMASTQPLRPGTHTPKCIAGPCPPPASSVPTISIPQAQQSNGTEIAGIKLPGWVSQLLGLFQNTDSFRQDLGPFLLETLGSVFMPDSQTVQDTVRDRGIEEVPGAKATVQLERGNGTFNIQQELMRRALEQLGEDAAHQSALSSTAQDMMLERLETDSQETEDNTALAKESQNLDVSQHIAQNQSAQLAQIGRSLSRLFQESTQARIDNAVSNTLQAKNLKVLSGQRTAERRMVGGLGTTAALQGAQMTLPGGVSLSASSPTERTAQNTSPNPFQ